MVSTVWPVFFVNCCVAPLLIYLTWTNHVELTILAKVLTQIVSGV